MSAPSPLSIVAADGQRLGVHRFTPATRSHTRVAPPEWGERRIGHMGFFRKEMAAHWPRAVQCLDELPAAGAWRKAA